MSTTWFLYDASTFADPSDIDAFLRCKKRGGSDHECFLVGDNGVGMWGDDTTSTHEHFVALHADDMIAKWGSIEGSRHRLVEVSIAGAVVLARVGDRCGVRGRIDLNPACQATLGLAPGSLVECSWRWKE